MNIRARVDRGRRTLSSFWGSWENWAGLRIRAGCMATLMSTPGEKPKCGRRAREGVEEGRRAAIGRRAADAARASYKGTRRALWRRFCVFVVMRTTECKASNVFFDDVSGLRGRFGRERGVLGRKEGAIERSAAPLLDFRVPGFVPGARRCDGAFIGRWPAVSSLA